MLSKPDEKWLGEKGHVVDVLEKIISWKNTDIYVCGGSKMVEETKSWLLSKGVEKGNIHFENYG